MRLRPRAGSLWLLAALTIAAAVAAPLAVLVAAAFDADLAHWRHLAEFVLPQALVNTLLLLAGVGTIVSIVGTSCAWLVTAYDFPGRRTLTWALLLPLAVPTYIVAFAYLDLLHPIGPVQGAIRWLLGFDSPRQFRLPDLRSLPGAIFVLGFVLYPYVYLSTRAMFVTQSASLLEAARTLGAGRVATFWRVVVPLARPAIAVGVSLALLETLNDIGASEFLGVQTLTVSVYTTWITRSDLAGAAQIALAMLAIVVGMIALERYGRRRQRYAHGRRMRPIAPRRLTGAAALGAAVLGWLPVLLGFGAPAAYLAVETAKRLHVGGGVSAQLMTGLANTLTIATAATAATLARRPVAAWAAPAQRASPAPRPARPCPRVARPRHPAPRAPLALAPPSPLRAARRPPAAAPRA
ncbi:ABC transporter permease subunit, partial [Burkholderia cenocepacia]